MDIRELILASIRKRGSIKASYIIKKTGFSRTYINRFFQQLKNEGKILLLGKSNRAHYVLATNEGIQRAKEKVTKVYRILRNEDLHEDVVLDEIKRNTGIFSKIARNVSDIVSYAFTEMLNNAIEHSRSKKIEVSIERDREGITFSVTDRGMGIYTNIVQKQHLHNVFEAIQDLTKGKLSTAPKSHSGEGIFFTSKVADMLIIQSSTKKLIFNNLLQDIFIKDIKKMTGTKVIFTLGAKSHRRLNDVFKEYADELFEFSKTKVILKLYKKGNEYISRSQARRLLTGLEKFRTVVLDFQGVDTVGQGFADEVFRVWQSHHPNVGIVYKDANENVEFMIKRAREAAK